MKAKILWIEGDRADSPSFLPPLRKHGYIVEVVNTGKAAEEHGLRFNPDLIVINAASMHTSGKRICHALRTHLEGKPILLINRQEYMSAGEYEADEILYLPFTFRKLLNRIRPFIPSQNKRGLQVGPITLDKDNNIAQCDGREERLTPRLAKLLQALMQRPGEVIERKELFSIVWQTHYTADTRSLDVHISWLRRAIEADPRNPKYLKTVRGIGYRLDV